VRNLLICIAASFCASQPALATLAPAEQPAPSISVDALELARLMSPRDLLIQMELREFDKHYVPTLQANSEMKPLEDEHPGLFKEMHRVSRPIVEKVMGKSVDQLHVKASVLFAAQMTPAEIAELVTFYRSDSGRAILTKMSASVDTKAIYDKALASSDATVTAADIAAQTNAAATQAAKTLSDVEKADLKTMMTRPAFWKLAKLQPELRTMMAKVFNAPDPEMDAEIETAVIGVFEKFVGPSAKAK
jgi:hypothetical protein